MYDIGVVKAIWYGFFQFFANFFVFGSMVAILALGAYLTKRGDLTIG